MIKEYCGLFGVFGDQQAAYLTFLGLYSLQHRGEESCGITAYDGRSFKQEKGMGLVSDVFNETSIKKLSGYQAIGHVRYSTTGSTAIRNVQPLFVDSTKGSLALAHNGNLTNSLELRNYLEKKGAIFQSTSDSEIILHLMMRSQKSGFTDQLLYALKKIKGAYCLLIINEQGIFGVRDPLGFRPLCVGRKGSAYFICSETSALDLVGAEYIRDVEPGEIVQIDKGGIKSIKFSNSRTNYAFCAFEHVYFSRPDSLIFGETVHMVRKKLGRKLAQECPAEADMVIGVPDSGTSAALGFSQESGIPLEIGIIRNHYIGRTFIQPKQDKRELGVKLKFNILKQIIKGKRIVIVDDSIVRGTTSKIRVKTFRQLGAKEIHLRISCPPHKFGCFYGIDFPDSKELIARNMDINQIEKFLEVDSLGYLSVEGMLSCFKHKPNNYCTACWTGKYPVKFSRADKFLLEK